MATDANLMAKDSLSFAHAAHACPTFVAALLLLQGFDSAVVRDARSVAKDTVARERDRVSHLDAVAKVCACAKCSGILNWASEWVGKLVLETLFSE